jgi:hypothetical protein
VNGEVLECHSAVIFSKFGDAALQLTRCCALEEIYRDEAQRVAHDIAARWCALPLEPEVAADSESFDDNHLFPPMDPEYEPHKPAITVLAVAQ